MKLALKDPMVVFARAKGQNGAVREVRSVLDFNSPYCVIFSKDALRLGYPEAAMRPRDWQKTHPDKVPYVLDFRGIERTILVSLAEVSLGSLVATNVDAIVIESDLGRMLPVDLILGRSFLNSFKLTVDARKGYLSLVGGVPARKLTGREVGTPEAFSHPELKAQKKR